MTPTLNKSNVVTAIAALGIFAAVVVSLRMATGGSGGPSHIPECADDLARDMLKNAINDSPQAKLGLKLLKTGAMENSGRHFFDANNEVRRRFCVGDVITNVGRKAVYFNMSWADEKKNEIYLEIPALPF